MGETLVTLDCVKRILPEGAIIIEDGGKNIIDLCGIMGGENSAIDDKTKRVLLFVQTYNPVHIRRTCQKLSLRTDAATRFEKWVDPEGVPQSLERATKLLIDVAAAKIHGKVIDIYNIPYSPKSLAVHKKKIDQLLGVKISLKDIVDILSLLQFKIKVVNQTIIVTVPSFRAQDIIIPEDIIEEVARIYGYHNLPTVLPEGQIPNIPTDWGLYWETRVKNALKFWGFTESYTYSLVSNNLLTRAKEDPRDVLRIQNPLTEDNKFLRPHLLPSLLEMVAKNQIQGERAHIFEIGMTYLKQKVGKLPKEKPQLAIVASGRDYLSIKGVIEKIWEEIGRNDFSVSPISKEEKVPLFDQQKSAVLCHNIGILGEIKKEVLDSFGIKGGITACELDCEKLFALATTKRTYISPSKFPYVLEDLTFIKNIPNIFASDIILAIKEVSKLIVDVRIHTMYKNTITLSLSYQSLTKTLTNKDLELIRQQIVKILERKFQLTLKGIV